ncbi:MAG: hypothetical protein AAGI45_12970 [Cyanobacteria bacterium P01_H01_bin.26]
MASSADNEPASIPPRPGANPKTQIAPQLEDVLRNLNVNLEDELVRYRRQSHGRVPPPPPPRRAPQRQSLDLISVSASSSPNVPAGETVSEGRQLPTPPPPPPNPFLKQTAEPPEAELPEANLSGEPSAPVEPDLAEAAATELSVPSSETVPEGYLESSEELLKSIADQSTESGPEPYSPERKSYGLLKLAGLILVVLGGIGVGVAITYPSQLQSLRSRLWPTTPEGTVDENAASPETPDSSSETAAADPDTSDFDPPGPDLSTREFVELDLESLSTLEIEGNDGSSGTALPAPGQTAPTQQLPPPTATPTPSGQPAQPVVGANGTAETPDAAEAPAGAAGVTPGTTAGAATGSNFYVVTSYTGDASLDQARELVPDAFVRNFNAGARIQLAAFDNRAQAEDQVAFLTQQGAAVELFGPTNE